jgi:coproporphyrinogen III oxidase
MNEDVSGVTKEAISQAFRELQEEIIVGLEKADGAVKFTTEPWQHTTTGGGLTRVAANGRIIEKGGVNFSAVGGSMPEFMKTNHQITDSEFFATGVSIVLHSVNPHVPIIHMNVRYFETSGGTSWFGGGIDLTPHYVVPDDAQRFHEILRSVCNRFDPDFYPRFKQWADDYFFIPHRHETRGVGGIFFDHLKPDNAQEKTRFFQFVMAVGRSFLDCYVPFALSRCEAPFSQKEKVWQLLRRGRYAEFNLVYDRGTRFGLETGGRTESILMSLPPLARWAYDFKPEPGSPEAETLGWLRKGVEWI